MQLTHALQFQAELTLMTRLLISKLKDQTSVISKECNGKQFSELLNKYNDFMHRLKTLNTIIRYTTQNTYDGSQSLADLYDERSMHQEQLETFLNIQSNMRITESPFTIEAMQKQIDTTRNTLALLEKRIIQLEGTTECFRYI